MHTIYLKSAGDQVLSFKNIRLISSIYSRNRFSRSWLGLFMQCKRKLWLNAETHLLFVGCWEREKSASAFKRIKEIVTVAQ